VQSNGKDHAKNLELSLTVLPPIGANVDAVSLGKDVCISFLAISKFLHVSHIVGIRVVVVLSLCCYNSLFTFPHVLFSFLISLQSVASSVYQFRSTYAMSVGEVCTYLIPRLLFDVYPNECFSVSCSYVFPRAHTLDRLAQITFLSVFLPCLLLVSSEPTDEMEAVGAFSYFLRTICISLASGLCCGYIMLAASHHLVFQSFARGYNPDNIAPPFVTTLGMNLS